MASVPGRPGRINQDFTGAVPGTAVLIDGAGIPGAEGLCRHGVAWYATRLGATLLGLLSLEPERGLTPLLATAIEQVTGEHRDTCAVTDPISPSATVAILRRSGDLVEYLVLGDTYVVLDRIDGPPLVVTDPREVVIAAPYQAALEAGADRETVLRELRAHRNQPGGFWLAKDDPLAAGEAITGSSPIAGLAGAALLSNGAAGIVDPLRLAGWPEVMSVLRSSGPDEIIRRVRAADATPDDATITVLGLA
ncbi:hypothetical protein I4J89_28640 [Actinoplanes sp. NEAU-A11]|uniref:Protein phosphatase 2C-like protein n=2 Tax=Actinoplanes aureus TaxID=2792083 RepID=A0A931CG06_9ACTN|nr:hypothetical protein [Actinoplanes aureus]